MFRRWRDRIEITVKREDNGLVSCWLHDELKVGDLAPDFTLPGTDGASYSLSKLRGQTVVLAWFPKAFTGG